MGVRAITDAVGDGNGIRAVRAVWVYERNQQKQTKKNQPLK